MVALAAINNNPIKNTIGELRIIIPRRNTTNIDPSDRKISQEVRDMVKIRVRELTIFPKEMVRSFNHLDRIQIR